jgi:hypothetical protein
MRVLLDTYNKDSAKLCNKLSKANWAVQTDVGNKTKEKEQVSFTGVSIIILDLLMVFHHSS